MFIYFIITDVKYKREIVYYGKNYPRIDYIDSCSGIITDIIKFHQYTFIEINNNQKYDLTHIGNYIYDEFLVENMIQINDSIFKDDKNEYFYIYHNNKEYVFSATERELNKDKQEFMIKCN